MHMHHMFPQKFQTIRMSDLILSGKLCCALGQQMLLVFAGKQHSLESMLGYIYVLAVHVHMQ